MEEDINDWGVLTKVTGMTKNQALAYQMAQKAAKHRICPDAKAISYVGPQNAIEKTSIPKPKIENKTEKKGRIELFLLFIAANLISFWFWNESIET